MAAKGGQCVAVRAVRAVAQASDQAFKKVLGQVVELDIYDVALNLHAKKEVRLASVGSSALACVFH